MVKTDMKDKSSAFSSFDQTLLEDRDIKFKKYNLKKYNQDVEEKRKKYGIQYGKGYDRKSHKHSISLPNSTVFFLYNDLHAGNKMKLHITKSTNNVKFLPRHVSDSIPFSSNKLSKILERFSVKRDTFQAKIIKQTIEECESPGIKGEDRFCPTSLESLLDFVVAHTGSKVQVLYNEIDRPAKVQAYTIMGVKMVGDKQVVCHKQMYPYAVYYCHEISATKVYMAQLVGADGTKAKAITVCHSDTSVWIPGHLAFLMLNVKPGEATICHFIRSDTIVWASNN